MFRVYLLGKPFIVYTDHHALIWLDRLKEANPGLTILYLVNITTDFTCSKAIDVIELSEKSDDKTMPSFQQCSLQFDVTQYSGGRRET